MGKSKLDYNGLLLKAPVEQGNRILIGVPMTGVIRSEWAMARYGQIIPCNWSNSDCIHWMNQCAPLGYAVAEARNIVTDEAIKGKFDWLLFIDHDVVLPPDCFVRLNQYMQKGTIPVVCGLYFAKAHPPDPLIYRGRGNSYYRHWTLGDKVWVDGIPMGCTLIHVSILSAMAKDAEPWTIGNRTVKKVFDTPAGVHTDPETKTYHGFSGTEDLAWCNRVLAGGYLRKAGWPKIAAKKYPFLCDTGIYCKHITMDGKVYPLGVG